MLPAMLRLAIGIAFMAAAPASAAGFDPAQYMPSDAFAVVRIENPQKSLGAAERLAAAAGMAPPGAAAGWMLSALGPDSGIGDVDMTKPLWLALVAGKGTSPEQAMENMNVVVVAKAKGKPETLMARAEGTKMVSKRGWVIGTNGAATLLQPGKKAFAFPRSTKTIQARTDIVAYLDYAVLTALEEDPKARELLSSMGMADMQLTVGAGLGPDGLNVYVQQHPDFSTPIGQSMKAAKNAKGTLVQGLPPAKYGFIYGSNADASQNAAVFASMEKAMGQTLAESAPQYSKLFAKIIEFAKADSGKCGENTMGLAIPDEPTSAFMLMSTTCKDANQAVKSWPEMIPVLNELIAQIAKEEGAELDLALKVGKSTKAAGVQLTPLSIDVPTAQREDMPELMFEPMLIGAVDKRHLITAWNADPETLKRHVSAAKKGSTPPMNAFAATQTKMLSPRVVESYINVGALASPFLPAELAPLQFALNAAPPLGMATQRQSDGSWLTQIFVPQQFAQLAAMGFQMFSQSQGGTKGRTRRQ